MKKDNITDEKIKDDIRISAEDQFETLVSVLRRFKTEPVYLTNELIAEAIAEGLGDDAGNVLKYLSKIVSEEKMTEKERQSVVDIYGEDYDEVDIPAYIRQRRKG